MIYFRAKNPLCSILLFLICILLFGPLSWVLAAETVITATITPRAFSTQQPARLVITVEGRQEADIVLPEIEGIVFHQRGQSSQFQMINGKTTSSISYNYLVQATKPGSYTLPPILIETKSGTQKSQPLSFTVTSSAPKLPQHQQPQQPGSAPKQDIQGEDAAFITLLPEKEDIFVGEVVPTTIKAYFSRRVRFKFNALPELVGEGVLLDSLSNEPLQQEERINNTSYLVLTWKSSLTGIKEGVEDLKVIMDVSMLVRSTQQRRRLPGFGGSFQDDFFDDFFGRYENQPIMLESPRTSMSIHALPETGKPDEFSGAIGNFSMDIEAQPTRISEGDPITLTMTISGEGNFDNVSAPLLTESNGLKIYSPTASPSSGDAAQEQVKTFEQAVIITDPLRDHLPPLAFTYFDPEKKQYETLLSDPIAVSIDSLLDPKQYSPGDTPRGQDQQQHFAAPDSDLRFPELAPVKLTEGATFATVKPFFLKPIYLAALTSLLLLIGIVGGYRWRQYYLETNPHLSHEKAVRNKKKRCLESLEQLNSGDDLTYLRNARQEICELLGILWKSEAAAITTADVKRRFGDDHPITELFTQSDHAAYGASEFSTQSRKLLHDKIITLIGALS